LEGLRDRPGRGRKPKLTHEQMQRLSKLLTEESPEAYGYNTSTWTGPLLLDWIHEEFHVKFKKAHIYNVIHKLGFSYQKAKGIYAEADPAKREDFKQTLKKNSSRLLSTPFCCLKMSFLCPIRPH